MVTSYTAPHSEDTERSVLGACLLDGEISQLVARELVEHDFYREAHRTIFAGICALVGIGAPVDLLTLQSWLETAGKLGEVGGVAYLASLDVLLPDIGRISWYIETLRDRSARRRVLALAAEAQRDMLSGGDLLAACGTLQAAAAGILAGSSTSTSTSIGEAVSEVAEILENPEQLAGLQTGFLDLDEMTGGLRAKNLVVLAGRPGMGKTSLALNIMRQVVDPRSRVGGKTALLFSLEMSRSELATRLLSEVTGIPFRRLRDGVVGSQDSWNRLVRAVHEMQSWRLHIDDRSAVTVGQILAAAHRAQQRQGLDLLVIDYLHLITADGRRHDNRALEIAAMTRAFKVLAGQLEIPVILLSQLSRANEQRGSDRRPRLSDLRESGAIEQDADIVAFVHREELYQPDDPSSAGTAELILAKHRNGETGTIHLAFDGPTTTFRNLERHRQPPPGQAGTGPYASAPF